MNLKYRIKEHQFLVYDIDDYNDLLFYTPQYKILGLWLNINDRGIGRFTNTPTCRCEEYIDAVERVKLHKKNMERARWWWIGKSSKVVWEGKNDDDFENFNNDIQI